jgi:hypothetical protein
MRWTWATLGFGALLGCGAAGSDGVQPPAAEVTAPAAEAAAAVPPAGGTVEREPDAAAEPSDSPPPPAVPSTRWLYAPRFESAATPPIDPCPTLSAPGCSAPYAALAARARPGVVDWSAEAGRTLDRLHGYAPGDSTDEPLPGFPPAWAADWRDARPSPAGAALAAEIERRLALPALLGDGVVRWSLQDGRLRMNHPELGVVAATVLAPDAVRGWVLVLPGHQAGDSAEADALDLLPGRALIARGYGLVVLRPRASDAGPRETEAALRLLAADRSLLGARVAEAILTAAAIRHLQAEGQLASGPVVLLGHSAGAAAGNALCRLRVAPLLDGCATDAWADYHKVLCEGGCTVLEETAPRLHGLRMPLSEDPPTEPPVPTLSPRLPYALRPTAEDPDPLARLLAFLAARPD